jgi:hypothetical protein
MKMSDYKTRYQAFSQEQVCTADLCELARVRCRVCGLVLLHHRVRPHLLTVHGTGRKGGYEFVKQTFHRQNWPLEQKRLPYNLFCRPTCSFFRIGFWPNLVRFVQIFVLYYTDS